MPETLCYFVLIVIIIALAFGVAFLRHTEVNTIIFEDTTSNSEITYIGMTHGATWGDFDSDGLAISCSIRSR